MLEMRTTVLHRYGQWWPILLGFAAMFFVYTAALFDQQELLSRRTNEPIALILLGISTVGFLLQSLIFRSQFHVLMAIMCAALFCREWHFLGSSEILYTTFALLAVWAMRRKELFNRILTRNRLKIWIAATLATYALSQLIARRVFAHLNLPQEAWLHIHLEETVETTGHLMMIVVCILACIAGSAMLKSPEPENA